MNRYIFENFARFLGWAVCVTVFMTQNASAALSWTGALTINSHDVVGSAEIANNNQAEGTFLVEQAVAQELLNLPANFSGTVNNRVYNTSSTDYAGTLLAGGKKSDDSVPGGLGLGGNAYQVPSGWDYAIAKYDGQNAGYVLFHLGGSAATLPQYSYSIWGKDPGQYQISNFSVFDAVVPEPTSILAGALLLLPLGANIIWNLRKKL